MYRRQTLHQIAQLQLQLLLRDTADPGVILSREARHQGSQQIHDLSALLAVSLLPLANRPSRCSHPCTHLAFQLVYKQVLQVACQKQPKRLIDFYIVKIQLVMI